MDERWIYTEQKITRDNKVISFCVVKNTVKKGKETVSPLEIADKLGFATVPEGGKSIVQSMSQNDGLMYQRFANQD